MKKIAWYGNGIRQAYGLTWTNGQAHDVPDDEVADDLLTQPGENFVEVKADEVKPDVPVLSDEVKGIGPKRMSELARLGIRTAEDLAGVDDRGIEALLDEFGSLGREQLEDWIEQAHKAIAARS